jgi:hypothetical protein
VAHPYCVGQRMALLRMQRASVWPTPCCVVQGMVMWPSSAQHISFKMGIKLQGSGQLHYHPFWM